MQSRPTWQPVINFWFGHDQDDAAVAKAKAGTWWRKREEIDLAIRNTFEKSVEAAARGRLGAWEETPEGLLALVLLTDQFPRNMYRDTARAFAYDALARGWTNQALGEGSDRRLRPIQRVFLYLPLEHSEDAADQERSVVLFRQLLDEVPGDWKDIFAGFHDYAVRHRDTVVRFGRFPHRNAILGRPSTAEELEFLRQPGSRF
jgi:uncharacterized protein (DUF924 family)